MARSWYIYCLFEYLHYPTKSQVIIFKVNGTDALVKNNVARARALRQIQSDYVFQSCGSITVTLNLSSYKTSDQNVRATRHRKRTLFGEHGKHEHSIIMIRGYFSAEQPHLFRFGDYFFFSLILVSSSQFTYIFFPMRVWVQYLPFFHLF